MPENLADVSVDDMVPHRGAMSWLDTVLQADDERVVARATVRPDSYFVRDGILPVWVGVEYMAQAVAAWAGNRARRKGGPPKIGLLLGTRRYDVHRQGFRVGDQLHIDIRCELMGENGLGMFVCQILVDDVLAAEGNLSVFEPPTEAALRNFFGESA